MSLQSIVRGAVAKANKATASLQALVTIRQWIRQDRDGVDTYGSPFQLPALIETGSKQYSLPGGVIIATVATVTFLQPVPPNGARGRIEPIDERDMLTLPDGTTGPVAIRLPAMVDPSTTRPYFQSVGIG